MEVVLMNLRYKRMTAAMALFVVFAVTQVYLGVSLAATTGPSTPAVQGSQVTGILTTQGNKPITVNSASAVSGATIPNGTTTIETPDGVGATINIPGHGSVQIAPNSKVTIEIGPSGNIKVVITQGCAVLKTNRGTSGELTNAQGVVTKPDGSAASLIDSCPGKNVAPIVAAGGGGLFGLGTAATVAIVGGAIGGTAAAIALANRGGNPSPSRP